MWSKSDRITKDRYGHVGAILALSSCKGTKFFFNSQYCYSNLPLSNFYYLRFEDFTYFCTMTSVFKILALCSLSLLSASFASFPTFAGNPTTTVSEHFDSDTLLVIDQSVKKISPRQYAERSRLREVRFLPGSKCTAIGDYAFLGCDSLKRINLPESLQSLGEGAFRDCKSLEYIVIPVKIKKIPAQLFRGCSALESVSLPPAVADIKQFAFIYCDSLKEINFPARLTHIGNNAFSRCISLEKVILPDAITEIESYAFNDCFSLREARLPANPSLLGELIFSGCSKLTELIEPSATPPKFDCESFIFDPLDSEAYGRCKLITPRNAELYRVAPGWKLFFE